MLKIKKIGMALVLSGISASFSYADSYSVSGGVTRIHTAVINQDLGLSPNPTGIEFGILDIDINHSTSAISVASGANIILSDFEGTVSFLGTTRFTAVATDINVLRGANGTINANRVATVSSGDGNPSVDVVFDLQNCSGALCALLPSLNLDLKYYTATATFNEDYSMFIGALSGMTDDGSVIEMVINGMRI